MQVVRKLISLSETVAAELDKEKNMSALVDVLLGDFYGVEVVETGTGAPAREEVKNRLMEAQLIDAVPTTLTPEQVVAVNLTQQTPPEPVRVPAFVADIVQPITVTPEPVPAPVPTEATVIAPVAEQPSVLETVSVVEPIQVSPTPEPAPVVPVNMNGTPGGYCDIHGVYAGNICIDCL